MGKFRRLIQQPPSQALRKINYRMSKKIHSRWLELRDRFHTSFDKHPLNMPLERFFQPPDAHQLKPYANIIKKSTSLYLKHEFDILGSGWQQVHHGMQCAGIEGYHYDLSANSNVTERINKSNKTESDYIRSLISTMYIPIDWHIDFKSGYRWNESTYYQDIGYGHILGVDIKVPWELSRMQHLVQLAWAYALAKSGADGFYMPQIYKDEFRNEILDFISANPPRWGVNWFVSMEIGIRAVNWLVAYDLFKAYGATFDDEFELIFKRSLHQHGHHIITHLEYQTAWRSNHYLANVVCLLILGAYFPINSQSVVWLLYGTQELLHELKYQFNEDGSNFEASTAYHRLSGEMVAYGIATLLGINDNRWMQMQKANRYRYMALPVALGSVQIPDDIDEKRIWNISKFMQDVTLPSGIMLRIGDDDSGRLLKMFPVYQETESQKYKNLEQLDNSTNIYYDEICGNTRHLMGAIGALFGQPTNDPESQMLHTSIGKTLTLPNVKTMNATFPEWNSLHKKFDLQYRTHHQWALPLNIDSPWKNLQVRTYLQGGYVIYQSNRIILSVRCGPVGQRGNGGHAHNDQLSIILYLDGQMIIDDVGSYIYTAFPKRRNQYRSVHAHFSPQVLEEPAPLTHMFSLKDCNARIHYVSDKRFYGSYEFQNGRVARIITLEQSHIKIDDYATDGINLRPIQFPTQQPLVSPKYGSLLKS